MSGLLGYLGHKRCLPILVQGLKLMRETSYDSGGILLKGKGKYFTKKILGSADELQVNISDYNGNEVIGGVHLRWATHGQVMEKNIHPIFSCDGKVAVMHKGLISNYKQLKNVLIREGHIFKTDTDTEVIAHLVEKYYEGDLAVAVRRSLLDIDGTYGLLVFYLDEGVEMVAANAGMGMIIGIGSGEYWVTMDKRVMYSFTDKVVYLNDGEMVHITPNGFMTSVIAGGSINVVSKYIETLKESASGVDEYFNRIEKEVYDLPDMIQNTIAGRLNYQRASTHFGGLGNYSSLFREVNSLVFIGSGSSYYAALMAKELFEDNILVSVAAYSGMDFIDKKLVLGETKSAIFVISQSGSTQDTLFALEEAKQMGVKVFGITNAVGSQVARLTDAGVFLHSGPTLGMPSTKSFMSQLIALIMLTVYIGRMRGMSPGLAMDVMRSLECLPDNLRIILNNLNNIKELVKRYVSYSDYIIVGSKYSYPISKEIALLMSEISDVKAESMDYSEIKYGLINRINQNTIVLFMLPNSDFLRNKGEEIAVSLKKRGAKVIGLMTNRTEIKKEIFSEVITVTKTSEMVTPILFLVCLQLWAFCLGKEKNIETYMTGSSAIPDDEYYV